MGNSNKLPSELRVDIITDRVIYNSGSVVHGILFVDALENFVADSLHLRVLGQEKCQWLQGSSHNQVKRSKSRIFFKLGHLFAKFQQSYLHKGIYAWPFEFKLPEELPGSFSSKQYPGAKIRYQIAAYFVEDKRPCSLATCSKSLTIIEPFRDATSSLEGYTRSNPSKNLCWSTGEVGMFVVLSKNVCFVGETIGVEITVDNSRSMSEVKCVMVNLVQNLYMCDGCTTQNTLSRKDNVNIVRKILNSKKVGCVQVGTRKKHEVSIEVNPKKIKQGTSLGTIVANYYTIEVHAQLRGICCRNEPKIVATLFIIDQRASLEITQFPQTAFPSNTRVFPLQYLRTEPILLNSRIQAMNRNPNSTSILE